MSVLPLPIRERDCYACFDMERGGPWTCPACGRPYGKRLPEAKRPDAPLRYWLDPTLDPRPPADATRSVVTATGVSADPGGTETKPLANKEDR